MNNKETQQYAKSLLKQVREVRRNLHQFQEVLQNYDNTPDITSLNRSQPTTKSYILTPSRDSHGQYRSQNYNSSVPRTIDNNFSKSYDDSRENSYLGLKSNHQNKSQNDNNSFHYLSSNGDNNNYINNGISNHQNSHQDRNKDNENKEILGNDLKKSRNIRKHHAKDFTYKNHQKSSKSHKKSKRNKNGHHKYDDKHGRYHSRKKHNYHEYRHSDSYSDYDDSDEITLYTASDVDDLFSSDLLEEMEKYPPKTTNENKVNEKVNKEERKKYDRKDRNKDKGNDNKRKKESKYFQRSNAPKTALSSDTEVEQIIRKTDKYRKSPIYLDNKQNDRDIKNNNKINNSKRGIDSPSNQKEEQKENLSKILNMAHFFNKRSTTTPQGKTPKTQTQVSDLDSYGISPASGSSLNRRKHDYNKDNEGYSTSYGLDSAIISPKNASNKGSQSKHDIHKKQPNHQKPNNNNNKNKSKYEKGDPLQCVEATIEEISESQYSSSVIFIPPQPDTFPFSPSKQQRNKQQKKQKQPKKNQATQPEEPSDLQAIHDRINELHLSSTTSSELAKSNTQNKNDSAIDLDELSLSSNFIHGLKTPSNVSEIQELSSNDEANQDNTENNNNDDNNIIEEEEEDNEEDNAYMNANSSEFNENDEENLDENSQEEDNNESIEDNSQEEEENLEDYSAKDHEEDEENLGQNEEEENYDSNFQEEEKSENNNDNEEDIIELSDEANNEEEQEAQDDSSEVVMINDIGVQTTLSNPSAENNEEEDNKMQERDAEQIEDDFIEDEDSNENINKNSANDDDHFALNEELLHEIEEESINESLSFLVQNYNLEEDEEEDIDTSKIDLSLDDQSIDDL